MPGWLSSPRRAAGWGLLLGAAAALAVEARTVILGRNWHAVVPGRAYRSAQLSPAQLAEHVSRHGIRTVVNLRGCCPDFDWYLGEARATYELDVAQEDITLSATRLPPPDELRRLVDVIEQAEPPLLFHCRQGVDRTGLAATALLLLTTDATPEQARRQLGLRYGHIPLGPTRVITQFFDLYDEWRRGQGVEHTPAVFRRWARAEYCPGHCRGALERLDTVAEVGVREPVALRVRAHNRSPRPWALRPGTGAGVHARFLVFDDDLTVCQVGRAGLFEAEVPAGGAIDLTVAVAGLPRPGRYKVLIDLLDGRASAFSQFGMEPLDLELHAVPRD